MRPSGKIKQKMVSHKMLLKILSYDAKTGIFVWKKRPDVPTKWNTRHAGNVAGTIRIEKNGELKYWVIHIYGKHFMAHRLAWFYITGRWPKNLVDHRDGDGLNNRFSNLREATHAQNQRNRGKQKTNTSGFKGVYWNTNAKRWVSGLRVYGKYYHGGYFDSAKEAHQAYCSLISKLHAEFAKPV